MTSRKSSYSHSSKRVNPFLASAHGRSFKNLLTALLMLFTFATMIVASPSLSLAKEKRRTRAIIELPASKAKFALVHKCSHQQYNLSLEISPGTKTPSNQSQSDKETETIGLLFGLQDVKNYYRLEIAPKSASLFCCENGVERIVANQHTKTDGFLVAAPTQRLLIKRRLSLLTVVINLRVAIEAIESTFHSGLAAIEVQKSAPRVKKKYQPTSDIHFADDFMQVQSRQQDNWTTVEGEWAVESVQEEVQRADVRRSSNPFSFKGRAPGKAERYALITTGYNFWDNYRFKAAVKSHGGAFGIAFYCRSEGENRNDYYLLRCGAHSIFEAFEKVQLLRVRRQRSGGTKREVLAEAYAPLKVRQWYELAVAVMGRRIKAHIDGALVFDVLSDSAVGGGIGLYVEGAAGASFDDIEVKSQREYQFDCAELYGGKALKGKWSFAGEEKGGPSEAVTWGTTNSESRPTPVFPDATPSKPQILIVKDTGESVYPFGDSSWSDYVYSARLRAPTSFAAVGLIVSYRDDSNYLLFRWGGALGPQAGREQLVQIIDGKPNILCDFALTPAPDRWREVRIILSSQSPQAPKASEPVKCTVRAYVDGDLEIKASSSGKVGAGKVGLYALRAKGARFAAPTVEFPQSSEQLPENTLAGADVETEGEKQVANEIFAADGYMKNWASPRGAWARSKSDANIYWHKSDFFGSFSISVPFAAGVKLFLSAAAPYPDRSYQIQVAKGSKETPDEYTISLKRLFRPLLKKRFKLQSGGDLNRLTASRDGRYVCVNVDDTQVLTYRDERPLKGSMIGISTGRRLVNLADIHITRSNVKDYFFESAPVDWVQIGDWEVTNRFSCDPRWSWFGGGSKGLAVIWNKFDFGSSKLKGVGSIARPSSFTLEFYASMRMNLDQTPLYRRPGDISAAICADGDDISSGYTFILSGWGTKWTRMLRKGELVPRMETERQLVPTVYDGFPPLELLHRRWFYIKIRKIGSRIEYFLDNERIFTYNDPEPLKGGRIAIWTQDNSIMVARSKISYSDCRRPLNAVQSTVHSPLVSGSRKEGAASRHAPMGWSNPSAEQGALIEEDSPHDGATSLRLTNVYSGGTFGAKAPLNDPQDSSGEMDISRIALLSFDYMMPPEVKVNLYLRIRSGSEKGSRRYFIHFTGRTDSHETLKLLGKIADVKTDNQWHRASFDIASAIRELYPHEKKFILEELLIGNFHRYYPGVETGAYLGAGIGGNCAGASYNLANLKFVEMEDTPMTVAKVDPPADSNWGDSPIYVHFAPKSATASTLDPAKTELIINTMDAAASAPATQGRSFSLNHSSPVLSYAWSDRSLTIDLHKTNLDLADGQKMNLTLKFAPAAGALNVQTHSWSYTMSSSMDRTPPSPVKVNGYLVNDTFEDDKGGWTRKGIEAVPTSYSRMRNGAADAALTVRDSSTAASGKYSLKLFNERIGGIFGAVAYNGAYSAGKYPLLAFDYKFSPIQRTDLMILNNGQWRRFSFTDTDNQGISRFYGMPAGIRDGDWHHAEVNLRRAITDSLSYTPDMLKIERIVFGDLGWQGMPEGAVYHIDNFNIIPAVSAKRGIELTWRARDPSGVKGFGYFWSKSPTDIPDEIIDTRDSRAVFTDVGEGYIYFHIRAQDRAGNWNKTTHWKFMVDNSPPELGNVRPASGEKAAAAKLDIPITDGGGSEVDPSSLELIVNDTSFAVGNPAISYDPARQILSWDWNRGRSSLRKKSFQDGEAVRVAIATIRDFAGNESAPSKWHWIMDYSKDKEPPSAPTVSASNHKLLCFDSFSEGLGQWSSRGKNNPVSLYRYRSIDKDDYVLHLVNLAENGAFSANVRTEPFDAGEFPIVSFDYKMPYDVKIHIAIKVGAPWYAINMTCKAPRYHHLTTLPDIIADRKWRSTHFDLSSIMKQVKKRGRRLKDAKVSAMIICDSSMSNRHGANYYIDNFAISSYGSRNPTFRWQSDDLSGIAGYSIKLDRKPDTIPKARINAAATTKTFRKLRSGMWYLHCRAKDRAGNWGQTVHYPYFVKP